MRSSGSTPGFPRANARAIHPLGICPDAKLRQHRKTKLCLGKREERRGRARRQEAGFPCKTNKTNCAEKRPACGSASGCFAKGGEAILGHDLGQVIGDAGRVPGRVMSGGRQQVEWTLDESLLTGGDGQMSPIALAAD
jgi:hypothetical protein